MDPLFLLLHTGVMAGVTYLVRMLPRGQLSAHFPQPMHFV